MYRISTPSRPQIDGIFEYGILKKDHMKLVRCLNKLSLLDINIIALVIECTFARC